MKEIYLTLSETSKHIDDIYRMRLLYKIASNYIIKVVTPLNTRGFLVGVSGLIETVGFEMALHLCKRAESDTSDKLVCKPRGYNGLKVVFYYK